MSPERPESREENERRLLRPYRRFVGLLFTLALVLIAILILRGIIRHLDRLPSVDPAAAPTMVDVRALRACADDLDRLETRIRRASGELLASPPGNGPTPEWRDFAHPLEAELVGIVSRCRLHEAEVPAAMELSNAATSIEGMLRAYGLLFHRHKEDGRRQSEEARRALRNAGAALKTME